MVSAKLISNMIPDLNSSNTIVKNQEETHLNSFKSSKDRNSNIFLMASNGTILKSPAVSFGHVQFSFNWRISCSKSLLEVSNSKILAFSANFSASNSSFLHFRLSRGSKVIGHWADLIYIPVLLYSKLPIL